MKRILALFLCVVLAMGVLSACSSATSGNTADSNKGNDPTGRDNSIIVGIAQDLGDSLDPYQLASAGTREVMFNVYEGLVKPDKDGNYVAAVASDYSVSDDGLTYTFQLREGVKFHNGDTVTADDVLYSFNTCVATGLDSSLAAALSNVQDISADGSTITLKLETPNNGFLAYLAHVSIVPDDYDKQATSPIGTGPFKFVSRSVQQSLVIEKFPDYYGTPAKLDKVTYKIYANATSLSTALDSGAVDLVAHLSSDQVTNLPQDYTVLEGTMNLVQALYLNNTVKPFDDVRVRQALCWAIDVDNLLQLTADGHGTKVGSSMYPSFGKYFDPKLADTYGYDVEKAKALLTEAGYPNGFSFSITVPSNYTPHVNAAEVICQQLKAAGIDARLNQVEWETWLEKTYRGHEFEATVVGFDASVLTADAMLERWVSDNSKNMIGYNNPEYDALIAEAKACTDDAKQTELYKQALKVLADTAANVYLQDLAEFVAIKKDLKGYTFYPLYVMDMSTLYWE